MFRIVSQRTGNGAGGLFLRVPVPPGWRGRPAGPRQRAPNRWEKMEPDRRHWRSRSRRALGRHGRCRPIWYRSRRTGRFGVFGGRTVRLSRLPPSCGSMSDCCWAARVSSTCRSSSEVKHSVCPAFRHQLRASSSNTVGRNCRSGRRPPSLSACPASSPCGPASACRESR